MSFDSAYNKFYSSIYNAMNQYFSFEDLKVVLIGSPGFLSEELIKYSCDRATQEISNDNSSNKRLDIKE